MHACIKIIIRASRIRTRSKIGLVPTISEVSAGKKGNATTALAGGHPTPLPTSPAAPRSQTRVLGILIMMFFVLVIAQISAQKSRMQRGIIPEQ
jgi:hypothetical protein